MKRLQIAFGIMSLVALLSYTLVHTGGLLAGYVKPGFIGYVCAFGIESAIVSLSLRIGELRRVNRNAGFFWFVLVAVVVVSALANISEGFVTSQGVMLTVANFERLDIVQAVIGLVATGLISIIVLAMSEIIGTDVTAAVKLSVKQVSSETSSASDAKAARLDALLTFLDATPDASMTQMASAIGVSRPATYNYVDELAKSGRLSKVDGKWCVSRNGHEKAVQDA